VLDAVLAVLAETGDQRVDGVVVTHGTDTLEETAFFVDLFMTDERPVVFTGAQRGADSPDSDGPANIEAALAVASAENARTLGALVVFDGAVFPARGTRKTHTLASAAFSAPDGGPLGAVVNGEFWASGTVRRQQPLAAHRLHLDGVRVDIIATYPGCDSTALDAVIAAGAIGVVLEATGAGNANLDICKTVARLTEEGITVLLSTRVAAGPIVPIYSGGGGGVDLIAAGAVSTGRLRPSQARMLLIGLLGTGTPPEAVSDALAGY